MGSLKKWNAIQEQLDEELIDRKILGQLSEEEEVNFFIRRLFDKNFRKKYDITRGIYQVIKHENKLKLQQQ